MNLSHQRLAYLQFIMCNVDFQFIRVPYTNYYSIVILLFGIVV
jgi:hypothetical protein